MTYNEFLASAPYTEGDVIKACQEFRKSAEKDLQLGEFIKELVFGQFKGNRLLQQNYKTHVSPAIVKAKVESGGYDAEGASAKFILECALEDISNTDVATERDRIRKDAWKTIQYLPKAIKEQHDLLSIYSKIKYIAELQTAA